MNSAHPTDNKWNNYYHNIIMPTKIPDLEVSISHIFGLQSRTKYLQNFQTLMASYPFARPDLWVRICPSHNQHTTNEITNTIVYFNNRRRQMAAHMKSDNRENNTTISSNMVPLFHLSFAFIYDYPPPPLHTSFITKTTLRTSYWKLRMHGDSNNESWNL